MIETKFHLGDRVSTNLLAHEAGTIISCIQRLGDGEFIYGIQFDNHTTWLHDCSCNKIPHANIFGGVGLPNQCWWMRENGIKLISKAVNPLNLEEII